MICKYCNKNRKIELFEIANTIRGKVYRRLKCKFCKQKTQSIRRKKILQWLQEYKKSLECAKCNLKDHRCLDFHHLSDKEESVSKLTEWSIKKIQKEIKKCIVLCANCHRIIHFEKRKLDVA